MSARERPSFNTIILAGSVLKSTFPWQNLLSHGVMRVVNDCGIEDNVLLLNQLVVLFTGMAGRLGFHGGTGRNFRNRFFPFGHGGYFEDKDGNGPDKFMKEYWIPLLTTDAEIRQVDYRTDHLLDGVWFTLLNNIEPLKLLAYTAPFVALTVYVNSLRIDAINQGNEALKSQSRLLAGLSEQQTTLGNTRAGILLALEGLPGKEHQQNRPYSAEAQEYTEAAGEFAWPETEDGEWDFLRPGREPGE